MQIDRLIPTRQPATNGKTRIIGKTSIFGAVFTIWRQAASCSYQVNNILAEASCLILCSLKKKVVDWSNNKLKTPTGPDIFFVKTYAKLFDKSIDLTKAGFCQAHKASLVSVSSFGSRHFFGENPR
jgi:hypothetical protein